jgi:hypothetical protein
VEPNKVDKLKETLIKHLTGTPPLKKLAKEKGYGTFKGLEDIFKKQTGDK